METIESNGTNFFRLEKSFPRSVIEAEGKRQALWRLHHRLGSDHGYSLQATRGPTPKLPERSRRTAGMPADDGDFWAVFIIVALRRQGEYCSSIRCCARNWLQLRASSGSKMSLNIITDSKSFAVIQLLTDLILTSMVGDQ